MASGWTHSMEGLRTKDCRDLEKVHTNLGTRKKEYSTNPTPPIPAQLCRCPLFTYHCREQPYGASTGFKAIWYTPLNCPSFETQCYLCAQRDLLLSQFLDYCHLLTSRNGGYGKCCL